MSHEEELMRWGRKQARERLRRVKEYIRESEKILKVLLDKLERAELPERAGALLEEIYNLHRERALALRDLEEVLRLKGLI